MVSPDHSAVRPERVAIVGAGDLGFSTLRLLKQIPEQIPVGFFDDTCHSETIHGLPILGKLESIIPLWHSKAFDGIVIAIAYKHMKFRRELFHQLQDQGIRFCSIIHPSTVRAAETVIGAGTILFPGCTLDTGAHIGDNCILNAGVTIAHDSQIEDHTIFGPGVTLAGFTKVEHSCFLGTGTTVIDNITINACIFTGAGTVVTKDLTDPFLYVGVPARPLRPVTE
tara:strand:- start:831 stop:1505 length:675 start_codon:yes stop_codon:yes gene_type:complete